MKRVTAAEAREHLDELLDLVASGEDVVITREVTSPDDSPRIIRGPRPTREELLETFARMDKIRDSTIQDGGSCLDLVNEGRRWRPSSSTARW